jgi:hypothetical protein
LAYDEDSLDNFQCTSFEMASNAMGMCDVHALQIPIRSAHVIPALYSMLAVCAQTFRTMDVRYYAFDGLALGAVVWSGVTPFTTASRLAVSPSFFHLQLPLFIKELESFGIQVAMLSATRGDITPVRCPPGGWGRETPCISIEAIEVDFGVPMQFGNFLLQVRAVDLDEAYPQWRTHVIPNNSESPLRWGLDMQRVQQRKPRLHAPAYTAGVMSSGKVSKTVVSPLIHLCQAAEALLSTEQFKVTWTPMPSEKEYCTARDLLLPLAELRPMGTVSLKYFYDSNPQLHRICITAAKDAWSPPSATAIVKLFQVTRRDKPAPTYMFSGSGAAAFAKLAQQFLKPGEESLHVFYIDVLLSRPGVGQAGQALLLHLLNSLLTRLTTQRLWVVLEPMSATLARMYLNMDLGPFKFKRVSVRPGCYFQGILLEPCASPILRGVVWSDVVAQKDPAKSKRDALFGALLRADQDFQADTAKLWNDLESPASMLERAIPLLGRALAFHGAFFATVREHYPSLAGRLTIDGPEAAKNPAWVSRQIAVLRAMLLEASSDPLLSEQLTIQDADSFYIAVAAEIDGAWQDAVAAAGVSIKSGKSNDYA